MRPNSIPAWKQDAKDLYGKKRGKFIERACKSIERIADNELLFRIVLEAPLYEVKIAAVQQMTEQAFLYQVAKMDQGALSYEAVKRISSETILAEIAPLISYREIRNGHECVSAREITISRIQNASMLASVAMQIDYDQGGKAVLLKLADQKLLRRIAKGHRDIKMRCVAVGKLHDKKMLEDVIANEQNKQVLTAALNRLSGLK